MVDAQGGVVPGADVALANEASRATRRTVTNASGFFAFAAIPAGTYTLTVTMPGFKTHEVTGIVLQGGDSRTVRTIALELATVAETVSVSAEVALTPLNSGEKAATLTGEEIRTMPVVGTSAAEVLRILPGMTPLTRGNATNRPSFTGEVYGINGNGEYQGGWYNNQSAVGNFTPNGARMSTLDLTIDGASGNDPGCNCATSVNPNTEFVQELKVLQSNYGAEHAKGPVALSFVSKQGGRDFHGSVFAPVARLPPQLERVVREQGRVGAGQGPLRLPRLHVERAAARAGHELQPRARPRLLLPRLRVLPAAPRHRLGALVGPDGGHAERRLQPGGLARPLGDLREHRPERFPGGIVPQEAWDPGGKVLLDLFPLPNADPLQTGGYNYVKNFLSDQNSWQALARVDVNLSEATKLYARYNMQRERQPFQVALWGRWADTQTPYPSPSHGDNRSDSVTVGLTHVFDPSLTSETLLQLHVHRLRERLRQPGGGLAAGRRLSLRRCLRRELADPGGRHAFDGLYGPFYANFGGFDPVLFAKKWQWGVQENVTKVWGTHTAKGGLFWEYVENKQPGSNNDNGYIGLAPLGLEQHGKHPRGPAHRRRDLLLPVPAQRRAGHRLPAGRGLPPGLLEGAAPADHRRRRADRLDRPRLRPRRQGHPGLGQGPLQPGRARERPARHDLARKGSLGPDERREHARVRDATGGLRLGRDRHRCHRRSRRVRRLPVCGPAAVLRRHDRPRLRRPPVLSACCGTTLRDLEGLGGRARSSSAGRPSTRPTTSSRGRCRGASPSIASCPGRRISRSATSAARATTR